MLFLATLPSRRGAGPHHQPPSQLHLCWGRWREAGLRRGRTSRQALAAAWGGWGWWGLPAPLPPCPKGLSPGRGSGTIHVSGSLWLRCSRWGRVPRVGLVPSAHDVLAQGLPVGGEQHPSSPQPGVAPGLWLCLPKGPVPVVLPGAWSRRAHCLAAAGRSAATGLLLQHRGSSRPLSPCALSLWVSRAASLAQSLAPPGGRCCAPALAQDPGSAPLAAAFSCSFLCAAEQPSLFSSGSGFGLGASLPGRARQGCGSIRSWRRAGDQPGSPLVASGTTLVAAAVTLGEPTLPGPSQAHHRSTKTHLPFRTVNNAALITTDAWTRDK